MYAKKLEIKNYSTQYSRVVPHHSTDCAITSLTSEIGRDPVLPGVYGRSSKITCWNSRRRQAGGWDRAGTGSPSFPTSPKIPAIGLGPARKEAVGGQERAHQKSNYQHHAPVQKYSSGPAAVAKGTRFYGRTRPRYFTRRFCTPFAL